MVRLIRLGAIAVIAAGALFSRNAGASTLRNPCSAYCEGSSVCPSEEWMRGYCAGKGCATSLPGCATNFGNCTGAKIMCNEVNDA